VSQQINLYHPVFLKQEKPFSARTIGLALSAVVIGLVVISAYAFLQARGVANLAQESQRQLVLERARLVQATKVNPQARSKALEAEVLRLEGEVRARQEVMNALGAGELGNAKGFSEFMAALGRQAMPGVWLTGLKIGEAGNDLEVRGRALRPDLVPAYLKALNSEPMMRGRRVTEMKLVAKSAAPVAAAPGVPAKTAEGPERFVEFTLSAPLRMADAAKAEQK
jgi:hypothetical protein